MARGEVVAGVRARVQAGKLDRATVVGLLLEAPARSCARERPSADAPAREAAAALVLALSLDDDEDEVNRSKVAQRALASMPRARSLATHPAGAQRASPGRGLGAGGSGVIVPAVEVPLPWPTSPSALTTKGPAQVLVGSPSAVAATISCDGEEEVEAEEEEEEASSSEEEEGGGV